MADSSFVYLHFCIHPYNKKKKKINITAVPQTPCCKCCRKLSTIYFFYAFGVDLSHTQCVFGTSFSFFPDWPSPQPQNFDQYSPFYTFAFHMRYCSQILGLCETTNSYRILTLLKAALRLIIFSASRTLSMLQSYFLESLNS